MPEYKYFKNLYNWISLHKECSDNLIFDYMCTTAGYKNYPPLEEYFDL